jgi:hypothetical protein
MRAHPGADERQRCERHREEHEVGEETNGRQWTRYHRAGRRFEADMHTHASDYHAVLVQGTYIHQLGASDYIKKGD